MAAGIVEIDVHGMNVEEAVEAAASQVRHAGSSVYRIRIVHGYHGGTRIRSGIPGRVQLWERTEGKNESRWDKSLGITELILREY